MSNYMADTAGSGAPIPDDCIAVAGYVDGFESFPRLVHMYYPHKHIVSIAVDPKYNAEFLDVENGAAKVTDVGPWLTRMVGKKLYRPGIYCAMSNMPAVKAQIEGAHLKRSDYRLWVADWPDEFATSARPTEVLSGYDAWQFQGTMTGPWDYSILADDFFPDPKAPKRKARKAKVKKAVKVHPKVAASTLTGALVAAAEAVCIHRGIHLTPAEIGEVSTLAGAIAGYLTPGPK
jgi:hypothetical protein